MKKLLVLLLLGAVTMTMAQTIPTMETGGRPMPDEWIDKDTGHRVIKLTRRGGSNASFYFHNNPFVADEMVFRGSDVEHAGNDMMHGAGPKRRTQMYAVNLKTLDIRQLTNEPYNVRTEIVCPATHEIFYQHEDSVFALNIDNLRKRTVAVMPKELRGGIVTVNADGTLLAGKLDDPEERKNHDYNLEPNVHYSPDQRWIIFRANFEGVENVYAVELQSHLQTYYSKKIYKQKI